MQGPVIAGSQGDPIMASQLWSTYEKLAQWGQGESWVWDRMEILILRVPTEGFRMSEAGQ